MYNQLLLSACRWCLCIYVCLKAVEVDGPGWRKVFKEGDEHQTRSGVMSCLHISRLKEPLLLLSILSHRLTPEISLTSLSAAVSFKHDINTYTHGRSSIALLFDLDRLYGFWRAGVNLHLEKLMCYSIAQLVKKRHYSQNNRASAVELKLAMAGSLGALSCVLLSWE